MPDLRSLSATFLIVTPMFLGGSRQQAEGFRLTSLKGALRFWWRALEYPVRFAATHSSTSTLAELRQREIDLFGSTAAQGKVMMRLESRRTSVPALGAGDLLCGVDRRVVGPGARYLGYGMIGAFGANEGKLTRPCLLPGHCVTVTFAFKPAANGDDVASFVKTLKLFGLVGGLGSRARRGWGSIALVELRGEGVEASWCPPVDVQEYIDSLRGLLPDLSAADAEPPFTAFGADSRIDLLETDAPDALTALDRMGRAMQRYRSWGHKDKVNGTDSERNFADDHHWSKEPFGSKYGKFVPRRIVFGLPQNYGKGFGIAPAEPGTDRRASPLLLHVHQVGIGRFLGVGLLLPARFLPGTGDMVTITQNKRKDSREARVDWTVLKDLLDGPTDDARRKALGPYFPDRVPVLPGNR